MGVWRIALPSSSLDRRIPHRRDASSPSRSSSLPHRRVRPSASARLLVDESPGGIPGEHWQEHGKKLRQVGSGLGEEERPSRRRRAARCGWRDGVGRGGEVAAEGGDDAAEAGVLEERSGLERPARERVGPAAAAVNPARS